jgi:hypothetical protein
MGVSRVVFATILGATGCDVVFPLETPDAGAPPYDPCGAAYDDPGVRYALIDNPNTIAGPDGPILQPWSWLSARADCQSRGMDLAVFNEVHEAGQVDAADGWPYWIGETVNPAGWAAVDACPPFFGTNARASPTLQCAAITSALEVTPTSCDGVMVAPETIVKSALCETPRPLTADCLPRDPALASYTVSPTPLSFDDARTFCSGIGAHVAVVDSLAEWNVISKLTLDGSLGRLWLGSTFTGTTWETETHCPAVYSWTNRKPDLTGGACAATVVAPDTSEDSAKLRLDGLAVTSCNDGAVFALCESN